jgi:hypothetical protein
MVRSIGAPDTSTRAAIHNRAWLDGGTVFAARLFAGTATMPLVCAARRGHSGGVPLTSNPDPILWPMRNMTGDTLLDQSVYTAAVVSCSNRGVFGIPRAGSRVLGGWD